MILSQPLGHLQQGRMARIDWALACDVAFFDREARLCIIGVLQRFAVPHLPLLVRQLMLVARLTELSLVEEVGVTVAVVTPNGLVTAPAMSDSVIVEMSGEYILATLRDVPLSEEGPYRFQLALVGQDPVSIDIPVLDVGRVRMADVH